MYTWVALRKPTYGVQLSIYRTRVCPKYATICIATHVYLLHTRLMSLQPAYCTRLVIYNIHECPKYITIYIETHVYLLHWWLFSSQPTYSSCRCQKNTFFEIWEVWVVMQLTPSVVTTLYSNLSLHKGINRGREVHDRRLESLCCYARGIWSSLCPHLCRRSYLFVLQSLEAEFLGEEKQQN